MTKPGAMARLLAALLFVSPAVAAQSVDALPPPPEEPAILFGNPVSACGCFRLNDAELAEVEQRAREGDADAAFRLSMHHGSEEREARDFWEMRAAQLGHRVAQYNVWNRLRDTQQCSDLQIAEGWLMASAHQELDSAILALPGFRQQVAAKCDAK